MLLVSAAAAAATAPTITVIAFPDLECASGSGTPVVLAQDTCGKPGGIFKSIRLPTTIPDAFHGRIGFGCGLRIFDDAENNCKVNPENLIDPEVALGACVPTVITGNFAGPQAAAAITLNCGPEI